MAVQEYWTGSPETEVVAALFAGDEETARHHIFAMDEEARRKFERVDGRLNFILWEARYARIIKLKEERGDRWWVQPEDLGK